MIIATDTNGTRYNVGDTVTSFRGELYTITRLTPAVGASTGRVYAVSNPESEGIGHGFYPSVFGLTVVEEDFDCEFCLNYGDQGDEGEGCFCCGVVRVATPVNDLARLEFLGQRLDILADLMGKATRAEIDGKQEAWDNSFRLASVAVADEMREMYRKASDEWKAEYDKVRLARGVDRLSDSI